ncbi:undecaprenyl-diphosphate phosphatase [Paratractidigestivibacter sp.]|uniref:undecaprenyl-diphosphate phosphatase n=1 Tax=Paratractidigestivibacter sp. TaxID=2847316 RepID=UPI002AC8E0F3|nr:undecaprenyl-diphosphate phosphatase [Paratractidigestivibacter sp.]
MSNFIELLKAAVFGVVEGITEWLPISSTGHMLLLNQFLTMDVSTDFWDMFLVVIQLGAILAVCVIFFHQLNPFAPSKSGYEKRQTWTLWGKTIVACVPAAVIGIPLDDWMEEHLGSPFVIAAALIVYGIAFIVIENMREKTASRSLPGVGNGTLRAAPKHFAVSASTAEIATRSELADEGARVQTIEELDWKTAIGIGIFQVLSMVPGTSRSGSTIIGGLILGCSRTVAAEFTFYLAIPVMAGASALRLVKFFLKGNIFTGAETAILLTGCAVAFFVSLVCIRFLMGFVRKHDFKPFGWYRIVLGIAVIAYFGARMVL